MIEMEYETEFYEQLQKTNKFERYARKLANKYFIEDYNEEVIHFKARLLSVCYDKGETYRINKNSNYKEMLDILKDPKDKRHKNLINYILINAFHKIEEEEADYQGKIKVCNEWVESPIMFTDRIENGQENELKYESAYVSPDTINRDDITFAKEIAYQFLRKDSFEFVNDVFELPEEEILEKYNYPNRSFVNKRINRIGEKLEQHREEINNMVESEQEKQCEENLKIVEDLLNEVMNGTDETFAKKIYEYKDNEIVSKILADNVVIIEDFLEMCKQGWINKDTYEIINALNNVEIYLKDKLTKLKRPKRETKFPINLERLKKNKERQAKYNEWTKPSDVMVYDLEGNYLRTETPNGKVKNSMKPKKRCNKPGCRELIDYDQKYCEKHRGYGDKEYNRQVRWNKDNEKYARFYNSTEWKKLRRSYILAHPLCERCLAEGVIRQADVVHHVIPIRQDYSKRLDWNNLESICHYHHNLEHSDLRRK